MVFFIFFMELIRTYFQCFPVTLTLRMANAVRLGKYAEFNPRPDKWRNNKRDHRRITEGYEVMVAKNYSTMGFPSVILYPEIQKGEYLGFIKVFRSLRAPRDQLWHHQVTCYEIKTS